MRPTVGILSLAALASVAVAQDPQASQEDKPQKMLSGYYVEPSVGFEIGAFDMRSAGRIVEVDGHHQGPVVGLIAGGHIRDKVFLTLEADVTWPRLYGSDFETTGHGVIAGLGGGVQTEFYSMRIWAAYFPVGYLNLERSHGLAVTFDKPNFFKLAVGFRRASFSANFEYKLGRYYGARIANDMSFFPAIQNLDAWKDSFMVNVSIPLPLY